MTTPSGHEGADPHPPRTLFECHQCAFREWRPADQDTWLCVVCGYFHWHVIETSEAGPPGAPGSTGNVPAPHARAPSSPGTGCLILLTTAALGVLASVFA